MPEQLLLAPILIPLICGVGVFVLNFKNDTRKRLFIMGGVLLNTVVTLLIIWFPPQDSLKLLEVSEMVSLILSVDSLSGVFGTLVALLWPLATLYAFEYMSHEKNLKTFYGFYTISYGVTLGIAFSANPLTMYMFYEFLTLVTTPLVLHTQNREAVKASRKYLLFSISGAAIGFVSVAFVTIYAHSPVFILGGILNVPTLDENIWVFLFTFVLAFMGFGVKAAIFPAHGWLPSASVAPTPVTALLHAVAVVKSGVFVIMRMTYYVYGKDNLIGTWAQYFVMGIAAITVVYASIMAVKEQQFKRRLAYSTISNLSYILLGVTVMTEFGFAAALIHMVFHAVMKISAFFCAGAVIERLGIRYVNELVGLGKKMPFTFICFTISSLSLMGMPMLSGFISKFHLMASALNLGGTMGYIMIGSLFFSSICVVAYLISICVRAYFTDHSTVFERREDPGIMMKLPIGIFSVLTIAFGLYSQPIVEYLSKVASGVI